MGYPQQTLDINIESNLHWCMQSTVLDADHGIILKLSEGCHIAKAMKGFTELNTLELQNVYGEKAIFKSLKWPKQNILD